MCPIRSLVTFDMDLVSVDLRRLRYFIAVAEELNFRRAADRLHISQPPLSQQIQALEADLGATLLLRDRRSVELTEAGEVLLRRARAILALASDTTTEVRRVGRGELGRLVVGFMSAAMLGRLAAVLGAFRTVRSGSACLNNIPQFISGLRAGCQRCRVFHGGGRRLRRTHAAVGNSGRTSDLHLTRPASAPASRRSTPRPA